MCYFLGHLSRVLAKNYVSLNEEKTISRCINRIQYTHFLAHNKEIVHRVLRHETFDYIVLMAT